MNKNTIIYDNKTNTLQVNGVKLNTHLFSEIPLAEKEPFDFRSGGKYIRLKGKDTFDTAFKGYYLFDYGVWVYAGTQVKADVDYWYD